MATAHPVNDHEGFVRRFIQVDHDFLDDGADQALLSTGINAQRIPGRRSGLGQRQERCAAVRLHAYALMATDLRARIDGVLRHPNGGVISRPLRVDAIAAEALS